MPKRDDTWPPEEWRELYNQFEIHSAWYSSDPNRLLQMMQAPVSASKAAQAQQGRICHVPLAADIARVSSALLFSEEPHIAFEDEDAQRRFEEIYSRSNIPSRLLEAAEICAALGGVFLKVNWDQSLADYPILSVAHPDNALPAFRFGLLQEVTFHKIVRQDEGGTWRLLEHHAPGEIRIELYRGTPSSLGTQAELGAIPETTGLAPGISTGIPRLLAVYVPNILPNRQFRSLPVGQPDIQGCESLLASLDEVVTSLLWDVLLGQGRLVGPAEVFRRTDRGEPVFDLHRRCYMGLDIPGAANASTGQLLDVVQFEIRTQQHIETALYYAEQVVNAAGYSPQTFGLKIEGRAESGTALTMRERKTFVTAAKKASYWAPALAEIFETLLMVDAVHLRSGVSPSRPHVEIQDSVRPDIRELAQTAELLARAQAASVETRVRLIHPDWPEDMVAAEVQRVMDEQGLFVPDAMQIGIA